MRWRCSSPAAAHPRRSPRSAFAALAAAGSIQAINPHRFGDQFWWLENVSLYHDEFGLDWNEPTFRRAEMTGLMAALTVFVLAIFVGVEVINKVPPTLHTPLMSGSNAISGITVVGAVIPSNSTQAQPSAGDVADLERTIRRTGVRAVFPEESVNPRLARRIAADTGAAVGGRLYGDTLGPAGSPGATYAGMLAANASRLVRGMSGGAVTCRP